MIDLRSTSLSKLSTRMFLFEDSQMIEAEV